MQSNPEANPNTSYNYSDSEQSIIENDDCIPDEEQINKQIELDRKKEEEEQAKKMKEEEQAKKEEEVSKPQKLQEETTPLPPIDFIEISKSNPTINSLIQSQIKDPTINLSNSIINLIQKLPQYSSYSYDNINKELESYFKEQWANDQSPKHEPQDISTVPIKKNANSPKLEEIQITTKFELSLIPEEPPNKEKKVYERLYDKRKKYEIEITEKQRSNSASIPLRTQNRLMKLYNDGKKQKKPIQSIKKIEIKSNDKSNLILYKKYLSLFNECVSTLYHKGDIKCSDNITLNQLKILMNSDNLGFLSNTSTKPSFNVLEKEEELTYTIFNLLQENNCISLQNFFIFSLSILNISTCHNENKSNLSFPVPSSTSSTSTSSGNLFISRQDNKSNLNPSVYFSVNKNRIVISKTQSVKIFKDFQQLNKNWKAFLVEKTKKKISVENTPSFKPTTNVRFNNKIKGNLFTHIKQSKNRQKSFDIMVYKQRENLQNEELQNCTFKPRLISHNSKPKYQIINTSMSTSKINKSKDEVDYELNKNEYTFKPNISISNVSYHKIFNASSMSHNSSEEEQHIERIKRGRFEKERVESAKMLREPYIEKKIKYNFQRILRKKSSKKNSRSQSEKQSLVNSKGERPILVIDIELNNENKRIVIYKEDKPEEISERFIKENNIKDYNLIIQIKKMIISEMNSINQ